MANTAICAEIDGEIDLSCIRNLPKKYFQEVVLINYNDIDRTASVLGDFDGVTCDYTVQMVLKEGKKGVMFKIPETSGSIFGTTAKSTVEVTGLPQYLHLVQILAMGISSEIKCLLDKLGRGKYIVAAQLADGTVEIYGWENGVSAGDYTIDLAAGGGASVVPLQSKDTAQESMLPLIYKPQTGGSANADFNEQFTTLP